MASSHGWVDVVRSLIHRSADLNAKCQDRVDHLIYVMWTPLHVAIQKEHRDIVLLLLEGGADSETLNSRNETALYFASSRGCDDIVRQLISHGADLNAECQGSVGLNINVTWTALHLASYKGKAAITRTLLEHGANPNAPDTKGATALHLAIRGSGKVIDVELLLEYGANADVRDKKGWTPLHEAA